VDFWGRSRSSEPNFSLAAGKNARISGWGVDSSFSGPDGGNGKKVIKGVFITPLSIDTRAQW